MDPHQVTAYSDSLNHCAKLIGQLEREKDEIRKCLSGEMLQVYLNATEEAIKRVKAVRSSLQSLQNMQQQQQQQ